MPVLLHVVRPGPSSTAPTSTGTPTSRTAASISALRRGVAERVDVGGVLRPDHEVGRGDLAGPDVGGEPVRRVDVVAQHLLALAQEVQPDARHVALHQRDGDLPPLPRAADRAATSPTRRARRRRPAPAAPAVRRSAAGSTTAAASSAPDSAVAKVTSGAPPRAAYGVNGDAVSAKASRPQGKPPNGHGVPRQLLGHPEAGRPTAASPAAGARPGAARRAGPGSRLEQRQQEPGVGTDDRQPGQQRDEGAEPVHQAEQGAAAGPLAAAEQDQSGHADRRQRPRVVRRERDRDQRAADDGGGQPWPERERTPRRRATPSAAGVRAPVAVVVTRGRRSFRASESPVASCWLPGCDGTTAGTSATVPTVPTVDCRTR